jgi:hypothetical protein
MTETEVSSVKLKFSLCGLIRSLFIDICYFLLSNNLWSRINLKPKPKCFSSSPKSHFRKPTNSAKTNRKDSKSRRSSKQKRHKRQPKRPRKQKARRKKPKRKKYSIPLPTSKTGPKWSQNSRKIQTLIPTLTNSTCNSQFGSSSTTMHL